MPLKDWVSNLLKECYIWDESPVLDKEFDTKRNHYFLGGKMPLKDWVSNLLKEC